MAATSSPSSSRSPQNKRANTFRPQFPVDPFGSSTLAPRPGSSSISSSLSEPWLLKPDQIPFSAGYRRDVILVLGSESGTCSPAVLFHLSLSPLPAPSTKCIAALLASQSLIHSLVIFASHSPPTIPSNPAPTVRVLRLASPLAVEDAGAVRLVSTLEWAERVARLWRASGSDGAGIVYYDEAAKDTPAPTPGSVSRKIGGIPSGSVESLGKKSCRSMKGLPSLLKRRLSTTSTLSGFLSGGSGPPVDPSQRPFDAIINYTPHDVAEKHVLKQTILVTSITRPFLAPTLSPYHKLSEAKRSGRRNSRKRLTSTYSLPPTPPYQSGDLPTQASSSTTAISVLSVSAMPPPPSHMIHVVPPTTRIGLARNLDSFLSSFSQQAVGTEEVDHAKQYILNSSTMREVIVHPHFDQDESTVLDLILLGGLDSVSGKSWIGSSRDILFLPTPGPSPASSTPPTLRKPVRSKSPPDSFHSVDPVSPPRTRARSPPLPSPPLSSGSLRKTRGVHRIAEHSQPVREHDGFVPSNLPPYSDPVRYSSRGPHQPSSLGASSGRATRRSKLNMITKPDDPIFSESGLPTPPDSDEDGRQTLPYPRTPASEVSTSQKKRFKWQFWRS